MYKTVEKYKFGMMDTYQINIGIIERIVNPNDNKIEFIVVHKFGSSCLVEADLSEQYGLPENISLYRVKELKDFSKFKESGNTESNSNAHLFMLNKSTGMWDSRWPDDLSRKFKWALKLSPYSMGPLKTEAYLVPLMRKCVEQLQSVYTYICPVHPNHPTKFADFYINNSFTENSFKRAKRRFNAAFKQAPIQKTYENCLSHNR